MHKRLPPAGILILAITLAAGCGKEKGEAHGQHESHSVSEQAGPAEAGHAGESEAGHNAHQGEAPGAHAVADEMEVTPEVMKMAGITLAKAETGRISISLDLSGEVGFNEDRLVHITPRFAGIAKEVKAGIGDYVNAGDVVAVIEGNESLAHYSLKAAISGRIIEKHISPGEHVSEQESVFMLADLSTVWVNLAVYPKDASKVRPGQRASISAVGSDINAQGAIGYVTPVMDAQTRKITARVVLPNGNGAWRPGTFVNAHVEIGEGEEGLVVDKAAVQVLGTKNVVFVQHEPNMFKPVEVTIGESDSRRTRILNGLEAGAEYVNNGAFELKAKIVTSSLGGHAGHGH